MLRRIAPRTHSLLLQGGGGASASVLPSTHLVAAARGVQFQQTSDTLSGINKNKRELATKWITKSTQDYAAEATRALTANPMRDKLKAQGDEKKKFVSEVVENSDKVFEREMDRLQDYKQRKWRKSRDFFKRQGIVFTMMYMAVYLLCLGGLYLGFATGKVSKEQAYGVVSILLAGFMEHDEFYRRVEAWDTYVNFGFAFVLNEAVEVLRLPFMMFTFYTFRPFLVSMGRKTRKSIFKRSAAEH